MALPRFARLVAATRLGPDTRLLELAMAGGEPLGFQGGQYVIIDSGLTLPNGKAAKRAYSILSPEGEQTRIQLASKRLPGGLGSGYLHDLQLGSEVKFSGPWGKLTPAEGASGSTLVLATDTGITAALGLVTGRRFVGLRPKTRFVWLRPTADYFLPEALVRTWLPDGLGRVEIGVLPPIGHPERVAWVRDLLRDLLGGEPPGLGQAFLAGDGLINYALLDDLIAAGVPASKDSVESFFNMPKKSAGTVP